MCERACAEVDAVAPGKVYVGLLGEGGEDYYGSVCLFCFFCFVFGRGRKGGDEVSGGEREDDGISGCRCVSFGLAVTSCFHTIINTAHPLTTASTAGGEEERKKTYTRIHIVLFFFFFFLCNIDM